MEWKWSFGLRGLTAIVVAGCIAGCGQSRELPGAGDSQITRPLKPICETYEIPAVAGAVVRDSGLEAIGVVGVRRKGESVPVTPNDLWHLGSETKAMTATLFAVLVERGFIDWGSTVAEVFPEMVAEFHPEARKVTMLHLLGHRAGLPPNLDWRSLDATGDVRRQRREAVRRALAEAPLSPPGSQYEYSNLGYVVVGAAIENRLDTSWEEAMRELIFAPLGMESAGFGGTGTPGELDQPWGHTEHGVPVNANGPGVDNPPVMGPAGRVHCTLGDWAKFVADHLRGARGGSPTLLQAESYTRLHTPVSGGNYAPGWIVVSRDWGGGVVLNHAGSNTMNFANAWLAPKRGFALLVCLNQGGDTAFRASDAAVQALLSQAVNKP